MKEIKQNHRLYMPGLDGIRALAVLAVISYHLNWGWASGGFLGVSIFFVLSGYLITDMLLEERKNKQRIDLKRFWIRRIRRLLPAMMAMIITVAVYLAITDIPRLISIQGDIWSALTYTSNWYNIFHHISYFESFGPPSPIGHLWSLAIEEQFYLLWPLLVIGLSRFFSPTRGKFVLLTLAGAILSFVAMVLLYEPGTDPSRVYYGTDTRAFGLLIGASLAFIWPSSKLAEPNLRKHRLWIDMTGVIGLLIVIYMFIRTGEYDQSLYTGGMLILSFVSSFVIAAAASPSSLVSKILGWNALRWIGKRSYSIYLWHYPVIVITNPTSPTTDTNYFLLMIQLTLSIGLAAWSYSFIETPFRTGNWGIWSKMIKFRSNGMTTHHPFKFLVRTVPLVILMLICVSNIMNLSSTEVAFSSQSSTRLAGTTSPAGQSPELTSDVLTTSPDVNQSPGLISPVPTSTPIGKNSVALTTPTPTASPKADNSPARTSPVPTVPKTENPAVLTSPAPTATPKAENSTELTSPAPVNTSGTNNPVLSTQSVTAIGDSVMLGAAPVLEKMIPGITVDGKVSRQLSQAPDMIKQFNADNTLGRIVVIHLGTNGPFTSEQLDILLEMIGENRKVILINTRVPKKWEYVVNGTLAGVSRGRTNVKLVDWYSFSANKPDWFVSDGVHLTVKGAEAYSKLILNAVTAMSNLDHK
jgi:peptidoglycan/LPS O-acetylase OafA/YrhL